MYTNEERKKRVKDLDPVAKDLITNKRPEDARKMISEMCSEDAYILGEHIGGLLEVGYHMHGNDLRGALVHALEEADKKGESPLSLRRV